jgi:hypothetical protein
MSGERKRQGIDDAVRQLVLNLKEIAQRHLRCLRPAQRPGRYFGELSADPQLLTGPQQGAREDHVDVCICGDSLRIDWCVREPGCDHAGAHDQRCEA